MKSWTASLRLLVYFPGWYAASALIWVLAFFVDIGTGLAVRELLDGLAAGPATLANGWTWIALILAIHLGRAFIDPPASYVFASHLGRLETLLRANLLRGYLRRLGQEPMREVGGVGDALNRLRDDVGPLGLLTSDWYVDASGRAVRLVVMVAILLSVSPKVTLVVLPPLMICVLLGRVLTARLVRWREASRRATGAMAGFLNEILGTVQAIKLAGAESAAARRLGELGEARRRTAVRETLAGELTMGGLDGLTCVASGLILLLAAPALASGRFTVGDLALFITYMGPLADAVSFFTHVLVVHRQADVSLERMAALVPTGQAASIVARAPVYMDGRWPAPTALVRRPEDTLHHLEVQELTCVHAASGRGLTGVNLLLRAGTLTVVTGRIGSGKSTLLQAILGLLPLASGRVLWNGRPVEDRGAFFQPPRCAYVPQSPVLFSDSLRANLLLERPVAPDQLQEALHRAVLAADVATLAQGLETVIGPRGVKLSGGQQQRAAAARAFLLGPELLVLDDLSSALDAETERLLWQRLLDAPASGPRPTLLVVSHRREVLRLAHHLLVLQEGRVVAQGPPDRLLNTCPILREWSDEG